jgi:hypothetical protein
MHQSAPGVTTTFPDMAVPSPHVSQMGAKIWREKQHEASGNQLINGINCFERNPRQLTQFQYYNLNMCYEIFALSF